MLENLKIIKKMEKENIFIKMVYDGEFIDDLFDGNGKYFWNDGKKYKGLFKNGLINWKGEFIWNDNSIYVGEYINNIKQFENNEPNGNGYFEYNNKRYNEIFDNGKLLLNDKSILSKNKIWKKRNYNKFKCKYEWYFML